MGGHLFLSYSSRDGRGLVEQLRAELERRCPGVPVWIDRRCLRPGTDYLREIDEKIRTCAWFGLLMTPDSVGSDSFCSKELARAARYRKPIIPLHAAAGTVPPFLLENIHHVELVRDFEKAVDELLKHLQWLGSLAGKKYMAELHRAFLSRECRTASADSLEDVETLRKELAQAEEEIESLERQGPEVLRGVGRWRELGSAGPGFSLGRAIVPRDQEVVVADCFRDDRSERVRLHILAADGLPRSRAWFRQRCRCWRSIEHTGVVRVLPGSDPDCLDPGPFLVTEDLAGWNTLSDALRHSREMERDEVLRVVRAVAEVAVKAGEAGVRLQSISPDDIYVRGEAVKVGNFDTASPVRGGEISRPESWRPFSPEWKHMAPEVDQGFDYLPETVDVFALGVLLQRLREHEGRPLREISTDERLDPLAAIVFHCLVQDPNVRFQSVRQLLTLLGDRVSSDSAQFPPTVEVGNGLRFAKYLTTNADYERFCREEHMPLPAYMTQPGKAAERLRGPWLPVTCVSLRDARAYCDWLSHKTGVPWCLPTSEEWGMAARLREHRGIVHVGHSLYPWGADPPRTPTDPPAFLGNFGMHFGGPTVVGAFVEDTGLEECLDLAGNVWEWSESRDAVRWLLKGGAYDFGPESLQVCNSRSVLSSVRDRHVGFRVITGREKT